MLRVSATHIRKIGLLGLAVVTALLAACGPAGGNAVSPAGAAAGSAIPNPDVPKTAHAPLPYTFMPSPAATIQVVVPGSHVRNLAVPGSEFVLLPGDAALVSDAIPASTALATGQKIAPTSGILGPGPVTWLTPTLARLVDVGPNGTIGGSPLVRGDVHYLVWVIVAQQEYAGPPAGQGQAPGSPPPSTPGATTVRYHYVVVSVNAGTGQKVGLWGIQGPPVATQ
jgi:hypothetical protein